MKYTLGWQCPSFDEILRRHIVLWCLRWGLCAMPVSSWFNIRNIIRGLCSFSSNCLCSSSTSSTSFFILFMSSFRSPCKSDYGLFLVSLSQHRMCGKSNDPTIWVAPNIPETFRLDRGLEYKIALVIVDPCSNVLCNCLEHLIILHLVSISIFIRVISVYQ